MVMRTDPFRALEHFAHRVPGTWSGPTAMPLDAYRAGDESPPATRPGS
ncbi:MAG: hypothetical protein QOI78_6587 [Actinomycetota bacterium]|jgi:HSP20 family protein|nr:hypothetical protein [Actinomycetota bacterium]